ncbi:unnamed protein product [Durusdinium trenchii]|uniref:Uncharacterized protein n=2 Tax=Durusdinium trenchii TaxID=1381693 RepID=A0ABP0QKW0_9DINO
MWGAQEECLMRRSSLYLSLWPLRRPDDELWRRSPPNRGPSGTWIPDLDHKRPVAYRQLGFGEGGERVILPHLEERPGDDQTDLRGNEEAMKILKRRGFAVLACQGNRSRHVLQREGWRQIQNPVRSSISKHHASHWLTPSISANFMNAQSCRCFCVPGWTCRAPTPMTKMDFHYQRPVWSTRPASWSSAHRTPCLPMARSQARPT